MDILPESKKQHPAVKFLPLVLPLIWMFSSTLFVLILSVVLIVKDSSSPKTAYKYAIFSANPKVLGYSTQAITGEDGRGERIDMIFTKYKCPITGHGQKFVEAADKHQIPYWLVAAVAFQESSCGKMTPKVQGNETFNLYGWGVWGKNVHKFDSIDQGIETVSKYMSTKFISKGITEPCDIMKVYTPPSKGSWCEGIKFFRDEILDYETP